MHPRNARQKQPPARPSESSDCPTPESQSDTSATPVAAFVYKAAAALALDPIGLLKSITQPNHCETPALLAARGSSGRSWWPAKRQHCSDEIHSRRERQCCASEPLLSPQNID